MVQLRSGRRNSQSLLRRLAHCRYLLVRKTGRYGGMDILTASPSSTSLLLLWLQNQKVSGLDGKESGVSVLREYSDFGGCRGLELDGVDIIPFLFVV